MSQYGEIVYNLTNLYVASFNSVTYAIGTPALVDLVQKFSWQYEADTDMLKAYGMVSDALTITTHGTGTFNNASLDFPSAAILTGETSSSSGSAPNRLNTMDIRTGGSGLPYFSWIAEFAATNGARVVAGAPKCQLDKVPGFNSDQNKFRVGEAGFEILCPLISNRRIMRYRLVEGTYTLPTDSSGFTTFFSGFFS